MLISCYSCIRIKNANAKLIYVIDLNLLLYGVEFFFNTRADISTNYTIVNMHKHGMGAVIF